MIYNYIKTSEVILQKFEVIFYEKENGKEPVKEFLMSLDDKMKAKMLVLFQDLKETAPNFENPSPNTLN